MSIYLHSKSKNVLQRSFFRGLNEKYWLVHVESKNAEFIHDCLNITEHISRAREFFINFFGRVLNVYSLTVKCSRFRTN